MQEDLFKDMMERWGVKPTKGKKRRDVETSQPQPKTVEKPQPKETPAEPDPDEAMFQRAMGNLGVRDIEEGKMGTVTKADPLPTETPLPREDRELFLEALDQLDKVPLKDVVPSEASRRAHRVNMRNKRQLAFDAILDLHGERADEATHKLASFVAAHYAAGVDTVMVITGKGKHSSGGVSVLKPLVEKWILSHGKRFVASYGEAPRAYGGRGAFVLYLRKT